MSRRGIPEWGQSPFWSARRLGFATLLLLAAAQAAPVLAATGGPSLSDTWLGVPRFVWLTLNLILFWGGIFYFAGPPIRRYLDQRAERIAASLEQARTQRADVEKMQATLEGRIDELRREMQEMQERAEHEAQAERDEILAQAERDKERLLAQTRDEIEQRVAEARKELRRQAALLATRLAGEQLERRLGAADQQRLFEENLERLERELAASGTRENGS